MLAFHNAILHTRTIRSLMRAGLLAAAPVYATRVLTVLERASRVTLRVTMRYCTMCTMCTIVPMHMVRTIRVVHNMYDVRMYTEYNTHIPTFTVIDYVYLHTYIRTYVRTTYIVRTTTHARIRVSHLF